jgi:hypothetical protein
VTLRSFRCAEIAPVRKMPKRTAVDKSARKTASLAKRMMHLGTHPEQVAQLKKTHFEPINLRSLVLAARKKTSPESLDEKVLFVLSERLKEQTEQLLRGLEIDPDDCNWQSAFMRLARVHHGLGKLVHTAKRSNSNAQKWTWEDDFRLLTVLEDLKVEGIEGPAAFETIARRPELRKQFPYATRSQIRGKNKLAKSLSERSRKLRSRNNGLLAALTGGHSVDGEIEALLWSLDTQASIDAAKNNNG